MASVAARMSECVCGPVTVRVVAKSHGHYVVILEVVKSA